MPSFGRGAGIPGSGTLVRDDQRWPLCSEATAGGLKQPFLASVPSATCLWELFSHFPSRSPMLCVLRYALLSVLG